MTPQAALLIAELALSKNVHIVLILLATSLALGLFGIINLFLHVQVCIWQQEFGGIFWSWGNPHKISIEEGERKTLLKEALNEH